MNDKQLPEYDRLVATLNYWQCVKWQDRFEEVRKQVEETDFSAKKMRFSIGQAALLDDAARFLDLGRKALAVGEISESDLREWPIFRQMREMEEFKQVYLPLQEPAPRQQETPAREDHAIRILGGEDKER